MFTSIELLLLSISVLIFVGDSGQQGFGPRGRTGIGSLFRVGHVGWVRWDWWNLF